MLQSNARITKVEGGGATSEDWDQPAGDPADLFGGRAQAYYREKRRRETGPGSAGGANDVVEQTLIVETRRPDLGWLEGYRITFRVDGEAAERTGKVRNVEASRMAPLAATGVETTRLTLEST